MNANKKYFYTIITTIIFALVLILSLSFFQLFLIKKANAPESRDPGNEQRINSFADCVKAGNPVMESFPRQCRAGEKNFTE